MSGPTSSKIQRRAVRSGPGPAVRAACQGCSIPVYSNCSPVYKTGPELMCGRSARTNPIIMIHVRYGSLATIHPQASGGTSRPYGSAAENARCVQNPVTAARPHAQ